MKPLAFSILAITVLLVTTEAFACTCGGSAPETDLMVGEGIVPENARGVLWFTTIEQYREVTPELVSVEQITEEQGRVSVGFSLENIQPYQYVIRPDNWEVGNVFRIETDLGIADYISANRRFDLAEITVGEALTVDDATIELSDVYSGEHPLSDDASCTLDYDSDWAFAGFRTENPQFDPQQLNFELFVDRQVWEFRSFDCSPARPGGSEFDRGTEKLLATCEEMDPRTDLKRGEHEVYFEARFPGGDIVFKTSTAIVNLPCDRDQPAETERQTDALPSDEINDEMRDDGCSTTRTKIHLPVWVFILFCFFERRATRWSRFNPFARRV